jgi:hypothetical protein
MKVQDIKTLEEYDNHCHSQLQIKIPDWENTDWRRLVGDCVYDYSNSAYRSMREYIHEGNRATDLCGLNALLSNQFYYFGEKAIKIPDELRPLIKMNRGHKNIVKLEFIEKFENWITHFKLNSLMGNPQLRFHFEGKLHHEICVAYYIHLLEVVEDEIEETIC